MRAASRSTPPRVSSRSPATAEVVVSETTQDLLEGSGLAFEDAGAHELKGISGARRLYRVTAPAA